MRVPLRIIFFIKDHLMRLKKILGFITIVVVATFSFGQNVGINNTGAPADSSAALDISAVDKGLLAPKVVDTNVIVSPAEALIIYDLSSHCYRYKTNNSWTPCLHNIGATNGNISAINCDSAIVIGTLEAGVLVSGASFVVGYSGADGGVLPGETIVSTGVVGLTATVSAGTLAIGYGSISYSIAGTPQSSGMASFLVSLDSHSCIVNVVISEAAVYCTGTPTAVVDVTSPTGAIWMDRNLGASQAATSSTDAAAYGDLYQWGRFTDGHQCRTSNTTSTNAATETPGHGDFILEGNSPYDWLASQDDNLWQGVTGANNPCPSGYRLPTETELETERLAWGTNNTAGAFASPLKLPVAGYRNASNGSVGNVGSNGYYWSSTVSGTTARRLYFNSSNAGVGTNNRAGGRSVRCIKD